MDQRGPRDGRGFRLLHPRDTEQRQASSRGKIRRAAQALIRKPIAPRQGMGDPDAACGAWKAWPGALLFHVSNRLTMAR
jgi:hypothetical protein